MIEERSKQPNILYILADDLGWADLSLHGSPIRTPNIDHLADDGVELQQHYVCPMCTPTRVSLLTGRHPSRFGSHATVPSNLPVLPDGYQTLATVLRDAGYDTGLFGKWHLGSSTRFGPNQYGFNTSYGSLAGGVDPYNHRYKRGEFSVTWHKNGELIEEKGHVTDLILREASQWIETRDRPWFCYVPFTAVHVPVKPTNEWLSTYYNEHFDDDPLKDLSFKKYAAYTSHMDFAVGELLESLERTGQRDDTIIVFSSDNGAINDCPIHGSDLYPGWQVECPRLGSNLPFRGVKAQLYEGGIRTPTIVNWRGMLEQRKVDVPMQVTDWMPTFTNLVEAPPKEDPLWDGEDIWQLIDGKDDADNASEGEMAHQRSADRRFFWNFKAARRLGMRCGDWKLTDIKNKNEQKIELFNIKEDPYETNELSLDYPDIVGDFSDMIREERKLDDFSKRDDVN